MVLPLLPLCLSRYQSPIHPKGNSDLREDELSDFSKFFGGWVEKCGDENGGGERVEPALWANGKEVGEAWVSPVGESGHQRGHPWSPSLSSPLPLSEVPHFFPARRRFCHPWHCQRSVKEVGVNCVAPPMVLGPSSSDADG